MAIRTGLSMLGVNLSGGEYGKPTAASPGNLWTDYVLPTAAELQYYAGKGFGVIRLPLSWERMQPAANASLNRTYLSQVDAVVAEANRRGMTVILDLHNYGFGWGKQVGSADLPSAALADLWSRLASHYAGAGVMYGLMNEPYAQSATAWAAVAAQSVAAIRAAGARQEILVPGTAWDGAHSWVSSGNAAALLAAIKDPLNNFAFEVHQYLDANNSGTTTDVVSPTVGAERLRAATQWAESTGSRLFLGEFAAGTDAKSLAALDNMMGYMAQHAAAWQGATYWAGGLWWGSYPFSVEPANGVDKPQMAVLTRYEERITGTVLPGFDDAWYRARNPDVAAAGMDPADHYLRYGSREGRNPSAVFDNNFYLRRNADVAAAGLNPLVHYETYGAGEGRTTGLAFDASRYLLANPDVAAARMDAMAHYVNYGRAEGRAAPPAGGTAPPDPLVNPTFLAAQLGATLLPEDPVAAAAQAAWMFAQGGTPGIAPGSALGGWQAGLDPNAFFGTRFYLDHNADVAAANIDPLRHFENYGWREGRAPSAGFDAAAYLRANADVRAANINPLLHFLNYGQAEGRAAIPVRA